MTGRRAVALVGVSALLCLAPFTTSAVALRASANAGGLHQSDLQAAGIAANDLYGDDVAVSGRTVVVGAPNQGSGAVYVFTRPLHGWRRGVSSVELTPPATSAATAEFGLSVAIQGSTIVVGAPNQTVGSNNDQGAAYVFTEPHGGWRATSHPTATLTVKVGAEGDRLGEDVALSGATVVAGAPSRMVKGNQLEGAAYVYLEPRAGWKSGTQDATLTDSAGGVDEVFGGSVAVSGDTVVIGIFGHPGAGVAEVFAKPKRGWKSMTETRTLQGKDTADVDEFGISVAAEGRTVVVGAPDHQIGSATNEGAGYVFSEPTHGWGSGSKVLHQAAELTSDDGASEDGLGYSVSLSGSTIVAGAHGRTIDNNSRQGAAYGFDEPSKGWKDSTESFELSASAGAANDEFGNTTAVEPGTVVIGAPSAASDTGAAYVFAKPGPVLSKVKQSHASWALGTHRPMTNPKHPPAGGTEVSFSLRGSATVSLNFSERKHGHYRHVHTLAVRAKPGTTKEYVDGRLGGGAALRPGHCRVRISATNLSGTSSSTTLNFTTH